MSLSIQSRPHENGTYIIELDGEVTFENSGTIKELIDKLIEKDHVKLIVDLAKLQYMSSAGMAVLVHGLKNTRARGGDLRLINLGAKMRRVFLITQFTHQFKVFNDLTEAVNSFKIDEKQVS